MLMAAGFDPPAASGEWIEFYAPGVARQGQHIPRAGRSISPKPTVRVFRAADHSVKVDAFAECREADSHNAPADVVMTAVTPELTCVG